MQFIKKCYINTTDDVDAVSVINELKYAIRDSKSADGLLIAIIPAAGASLAISPMMTEVIEELKASIGVFGADAQVAKDKLKRDREVGAIVQSAIMGRTVNIPFKDAQLLIDPYDDVVLFDFEHKKGRRELIIQIISDAASAGQKNQQQSGQRGGGR